MSAFEPRISWVLERAATEFADAEGTVDLATGERRSWAETSRRVGGVATGLRDMGLDAGNRVGVLALNSARHFELWFAIPNFLSLDAHRRGAAGEEPWATRLQSAGSPVVGVRVEVRRDDGSVCGPGEPGEIYIQGPNIMKGYWNRDAETAHALVDGWYRSGDVAHADEAGYLFIVDRAKDMIISGGENIYTTEVENAVYAHPAVLEAAAFGVPHDHWGEAVHVEVVTKPDTSVDQDGLIEHCRTLIAGYKVPRSINLRTHEEPLPKSGAGKILKRDLRAPYWEGHNRSIS